MKRLLIIGIGLAVIISTFGGCWVGLDADGRGGGHDRPQRR